MRLPAAGHPVSPVCDALLPPAAAHHTDWQAFGSDLPAQRDTIRGDPVRSGSTHALALAGQVADLLLVLKGAVATRK